MIYEIIGYAASLLVAISLMMSAIVKLRIINLVGSFIFVIYGILIDSIPVAAMNGFVVLINIYYLQQMYRSTEYFKLLKVGGNNEYLREFIHFHVAKIKKYQPDFSTEQKNNYAVFVLRDMVPAGLVMGYLEKDGTLVLNVDYVIPNYRDFKISRFLFEKNQPFFKADGIRKVLTHPGNRQHSKYLEKAGFQKSGRFYQLILS